jgi:hypothetical protein
MKRKKSLLSVLLLMACAGGFSQTALLGKLIDTETKRPVANAFVQNGMYQFEFDAIINKSDSVLLYYNHYLLNTIAEEDNIAEYDKVQWLVFSKAVKVRNAIETLNVKKSAGGYYYSSGSLNGLMSVLEDEREEVITIESTVQALPGKIRANAAGEKGEKLWGSTGQLFRMQGTTGERFWEALLGVSVVE